MNRRAFLRGAAGSVVLIYQAACQAFSPSSASAPTRASNITQSSSTATPGAPAPAATSAPPTPNPNIVQNKLGLPLPLQVTPIEHFYVNTYSDTLPGFDPETWAFGLDGLVEQPVKINYTELLALPAVEVMRTLECIGNPVGGSLISNGTWKGVSLKALLTQARVKPGAKYLIAEGTDEYFTSVPLELGLTDKALLAYELNGKPLTPEHGRPMRVLLPGIYGQKQPKWVTHIEVSDHYEKGYWEEKGWSDTCIIQPNSRIDRPLDGDDVVGKVGESFSITGIALTSSPGVARVEVSTDRGKTWHDATLTHAPAPNSNFAWTRWGYDWQLTASGQYTILARVTDNAGSGQGDPTFHFFDNTFPNGTRSIPMSIVNVRVS